MLLNMDKVDSNGFLSSLVSFFLSLRKCFFVMGVVERENLVI